MHSYRMVVDPDELASLLEPILARENAEIPKRGCYAAAVEFDEDGAVVAYQMLQNAIFLEGLWSRDLGAHLRTLHNMATEYAVKTLGSERVMTMTRTDETGQRIGRCAERMGFKKMDWNVYRRAH